MWKGVGKEDKYEGRKRTGKRAKQRNRGKEIEERRCVCTKKSLTCVDARPYECARVVAVYISEVVTVTEKVPAIRATDDPQHITNLDI